MEVRRINDEQFAYRSGVERHHGGCAVPPPIGGHIEKRGSACVAGASDSTIGRGCVQNAISFEENVVTFRMANVVVMRWSKR
jgi:hypothetical protein